jgi:hypothetical protein
MNQNGSEFCQAYYSTTMNNCSMNLVITYTSDEEKEEILCSIKTIRNCDQ